MTPLWTPGLCVVLPAPAIAVTVANETTTATASSFVNGDLTTTRLLPFVVGGRMIRPRIGFSEAGQGDRSGRTLHRVQRLATHGHASSTPPRSLAPSRGCHTVQPLRQGFGSSVGVAHNRRRRALEAGVVGTDLGLASSRRVRPRRARARSRGRRQPRSDSRARDTTRCGPARPPLPGGAAQLLLVHHLERVAEARLTFPSPRRKRAACRGGRSDRGS